MFKFLVSWTGVIHYVPSPAMNSMRILCLALRNVIVDSSLVTAEAFIVSRYDIIADFNCWFNFEGNWMTKNSAKHY